MDVNLLRTMITLVCFGLFVGIVVWAYGRGRRDRFAEAASLPLAEEGERAASAAHHEGAGR